MSRKHIFTKKTSKFTRGEKCLFIHVVITFALVLVLTVVYYVHLLVTKHAGNDMFRVTRRSSYIEPSVTTPDDPKFYSVGALYLNVTPIRLICNTLLLRSRWSLVPGHCATVLSEPVLAVYLLTWSIQYKINRRFIDTGIEQTFIHSRYSRDDFSHNIGLLKHINHIKGPDYKVPIHLHTTEQISSAGEIIIAGWTRSDASIGANLILSCKNMQVIPSGECDALVSPIIDKLRLHEFCTSHRSSVNNAIIGHGALLYVNDEIVGFFSWGDKGGIGVPFVFLNIVHFKDWFEGLIYL